MAAWPQRCLARPAALCDLDHRSVLLLIPDYTLHRLVIGDGCAEVGLLDGGCGHG